MSVTDDLLTNNKIQLLEPYTRAKTKHKMKCLVCEHEWSATPLSKSQTFKKYGVGGCPTCKNNRDHDTKTKSRAANIQYLSELGIKVLSDWDGRRADEKVKPIPLKVKNINCGHEFTSTTANLLSRGVTCSVCGKEQRSQQLTKTSTDRSAIWQETAPEWLAYKARVTSLTTQTYKQHHATINPNNYPRALAGVGGAYHLDHIVPVRMCFENEVPEELAAHHTNLQMLTWRENVAEGGTMKDNTLTPVLLLEYLS